MKALTVLGRGVKNRSKDLGSRLGLEREKDK